jgi:hypothetical protein
MLPAGKTVRFHRNPKRKRGNDLRPRLRFALSIIFTRELVYLEKAAQTPLRSQDSFACRARGPVPSVSGKFPARSLTPLADRAARLRGPNHPHSPDAPTSLVRRILLYCGLNGNHDVPPIPSASTGAGYPLDMHGSDTHWGAHPTLPEARAGRGHARPPVCCLGRNATTTALRPQAGRR